MVEKANSEPGCVGAIAEVFVPRCRFCPMRVLSLVLMATLLLAPQIRVGASEAPLEGGDRGVIPALASGALTDARPALDAPGPNGPAFSIFLPLVLKNYSQPLLMGVYTPGWLALESTYANELTPLDTFASKHHSLLGTFIDIDSSANYDNFVRQQLQMAWEHGYTPFVNLNACTSGAALPGCSDHTALAHIAAGEWDSYLTPWIASFKTYAEGGGGRAAFIAPFQEMNYGTAYYNADPSHFKNAYAHVKDAFQSAGIPPGSVRWVFSPNGYDAGADPFEEYYPGDASVDVVAVSAYNFGFYNNCHAGGFSRWDTPQVTFGGYLIRLRAMAPNKPIFVAQTGTSTYYDTSCRNDEAKNQWLTDLFNYLASQAQVRGMLYYNLCPPWEPDWGLYGTCYGGPPPVLSLADYAGYSTGAANPAYRYIAPADLKNMPLLP